MCAVIALGLAAMQVAGSLTLGGSSGTVLSLVNDQTSPGASMFFGTDGSGTKGWYSIAGSEVSSISGTANQIVASSSVGAVTLSFATNPVINGNLTVSGTGNSSIGGVLSVNGNLDTGGTFSADTITSHSGGAIAVSKGVNQSGGTFSIDGSSSGGTVFQQIGTYTGAAATIMGIRLIPTYNLSGTSSETDIRINRTETALGSGVHLFTDFQVGGVSKWTVDHLGNQVSAGYVYTFGDVFLKRTGYTADVNQVNIVNSSGTDSTILGNSGSAYSGVLTWVGSNSSFIYFPSSLKIGTGTGGTPTISLSGLNATVGGNLTVSGATASTSTTTGALTVSGGVGIGGTVNIAGNLSAGNTYQGAAVGISYTGATLAGPTQYGFYSLPTISGANGSTIAAGTGAYARYITSNNTLTLTSGFGLYVDTPTAGTGATIATNYGIYISNQTAGGTNYAIYTNAGLVLFGDNVTIASGKTLQLGSTYSAGAVLATGTIAIKDSTGTTYNVLVHT